MLQGNGAVLTLPPNLVGNSSCAYMIVGDRLATFESDDEFDVDVADDVDERLPSTF